MSSTENPAITVQIADTDQLYNHVFTIRTTVFVEEESVDAEDEYDGFDFLAEVRKMPQLKDIPVVVVTAADLSEEDHRRLNGGVERILSKAAHGRDEFLAEVRHLVATYVTPGGVRH